MDIELKVFIGIIAASVLTVGGCVARQNELIAASDDPVATACALGANDEACLLVAERN